MEFSGVLENALSVDQDARRGAEAYMVELLKTQPDVFATCMLQEIRSDPKPDLRQLACVLFRKYIWDVSDKDAGFWRHIPDETKAIIKATILDALVEEKEPMVRHKVGDCVVILVKCLAVEQDEVSGEIHVPPPTHYWPELLHRMWQCAQSPDPAHRESALLIFSEVPGLFDEELDRHLPNINHLLTFSLNDSENPIVQIAATKAFAAFVKILERDQVGLFAPLLPLVLQLVESFAMTKPEDAVITFQNLIEVAEEHPKFFRPVIAHVYELVEKIGANQDVNSELRVIAIELFVMICETAPGMMKKQLPIVFRTIHLLLQLMTELIEDDDWSRIDALEDPDEAGEVATYAESSLDRIAVALGGKAVLETIFHEVDALLAGEAWQGKYAALMAISAIGEGCYDNMRHFLEHIMQVVLPTLYDPHPRVRFAACNAIGQMASDFAPQQHKETAVGFQSWFHQQVLPGLLTIMGDAENPRVQSHAAAALVNFCENASKEVLAPYLESILEKLIQLFSSTYMIVQEQAVCTLATVADSAQALFANYYSHFMPHLIMILGSAVAKEQRLFRGKTMECISLIGLAVGKELFLSDAVTVMTMLKDAQDALTDPDDPCLTYMLSSWARICQILEDDFIPYLPIVLPPLMAAINLEAELVKMPDDATEENLPDKDNWELVEYEGAKMAIRTASLDEKKLACELMIVYVKVLKGHFAPYVDEVYNAMLKLLDFKSEPGVRMASAACMPWLMRAAHEIPETGPPRANLMWTLFVDRVFEVLEKEEEFDVVAYQMNAFKECIDFFENACLTPEFMQRLIPQIEEELKEYNDIRLDDLREKVEDEDYDVDEQEYEDELNMLNREVSDLVHSLFYFLKLEFLPFFETLLPHYQAMIAPERLSGDTKWALCVFDDLIEHCGPASFAYAGFFLERLVQCLVHEEPDVRQAAAYGIGMMGLHGGAQYIEFCKTHDILGVLISLINSPEARSLGNVDATENAISAFMKLAKNPEMGLSEEEFLPTWLAWLPMTQDDEEAEVVYGYICDLVEQQNANIMARLPQIVSIFSSVVCTPLCPADSDIGARMILTIRTIQANYLNEAQFAEIWEQLTPVQQKNLNAAIHEGAETPA